MEQRPLAEPNKLACVGAGATSESNPDLLAAIASLLGPESPALEESGLAPGAPSSHLLAGLATGLMAQDRDPLPQTGLATASLSLPRGRRSPAPAPASEIACADPLPTGLPAAQRGVLERFLAGAEGPRLAGLLGNASFRSLSEARRGELLSSLAQHAGGMGSLVDGLLAVGLALDSALLGAGGKLEAFELVLALPAASLPDLVTTIESGRLSDGRGRGNLLACLRDLSRQTTVEFEGKSLDAQDVLRGVLRAAAGRARATQPVPPTPQLSSSSSLKRR